jgi:hypothetical protein
MNKKYTSVAAAFLFVWMTASVFPATNGTGIRRLTHSGNNVVEYPCLSDDGRWMLYVLEIKERETPTKAVMLMDLENGKQRELFRSGTKMAPAPFENIPVLVGSKPPLISGNGQVAVFSLTLGEPENIIDHYLGIINTDGTDLRIFSFSIESLKQKDLNVLEFQSQDWERVSNYAIDREGRRIACLLKGYLGPRRYGSASGIILLDTKDGKQRTLLGPDFNGTEWEWLSFPRRPLLGGGWAFCLSGNGEKLIFGAQSSEEKTDFDLYSAGWDGKETKRITDFHDRWFSLADISYDGKVLVFSYSGKKIDGMGTYVMNADGSGLRHLKSGITPKIEFFDLSGNGRILLYKHIYTGMVLDLQTGRETVAFDQDTPGYIKGLIPMDFPRIPAFWRAQILSFSGDRALLVGPPLGKEMPEIYLLQIEVNH